MKNRCVESPLTDKERELVYLALRCNDGPSLCPHWEADKQRRLTDALDRLRLVLMPD